MVIQSIVFWGATMKKAFLLEAVTLALLTCQFTAVYADVVLEPFTYHEDFETRELSAWASYPLWQDTAYDPNIRVNEIVPNDPNISMVQVVSPRWLLLQHPHCRRPEGT